MLQHAQRAGCCQFMSARISLAGYGGTLGLRSQPILTAARHQQLQMPTQGEEAAAAPDALRAQCGHISTSASPVAGAAVAPAGRQRQDAAPDQPQPAAAEQPPAAATESPPRKRRRTTPKQTTLTGKAPPAAPAAKQQRRRDGGGAAAPGAPEHVLVVPDFVLLARFAALATARSYCSRHAFTPQLLQEHMCIQHCGT